MTDETALTVPGQQYAVITDDLHNGLVPALAKIVTFTPQGLQLPDGLTFEQAQGITHYIAEAIKRDVLEVNLLQLCLGQVINFSESHFGDKYSQWLDETGLAYGTLANAAYVARNVKNWHGTVAFSCHTAVAPLKPDEQERWLTVAEEEGIGPNELRRRIQADRDVKAGRDPDQADIERQLQRIAGKMIDKLNKEQRVAAINRGLLLPLSRQKSLAATDDYWAALVEGLDGWRWSHLENRLDEGETDASATIDETWD